MEETSTKRTLGLLDTTLLVAGSMIGSGIFIVSSEMARTVGSPAWLLVCWVLTGLITVFAALSYGELAGMMPQAGGQYVYLRKAYNPLVAFLYGWTVFLVIQTGVIAAVAVAFAKYTGVFLPVFNEDHVLLTIGTFKLKYAQLLAIACIAFLTWLNIQGIQYGKLIQRSFTSAKLIALFGLIAIGIYFGFHTDTLSLNFTDAWTSTAQVPVLLEGKPTGAYEPMQLQGFILLGAVGVALIGSLFSSDAWNNVTFIAAEIKEPQKNIPLGLFFGTFIVTIIYVLANIAYLCLLPMHDIQFAGHDRVGAAAMAVVFSGNTATYLMAGLIIVSTFGCNNGLILAGSRLFQAMAKDGLFFKRAAALNSKGVPGNSLVFQGIWASVLCLSGSYNDLLEYATFASLVFYMVTIGAIFILRKKDPLAERPYKAFGYPIVPALYIVVTFAICADLLYFKTASTGIGLCIVALGIPVYYFIARKKHAAL
ncbi:MAG: amino acid transporter [Bacteroidetes bacterium]|jgi:APA family basic amino acid/polyamine antiporter|nr:amino acid transporter [Bacteroidota bacterium]